MAAMSEQHAPDLIEDDRLEPAGRMKECF